LTARVAEQAGAEVVIITGAGVAASLLGTPDVGLLTMSEVLSQTRNIVRSVSIPVVADCDTGYGNPINVQRTIREFENAGVAALFMEDQVAPKRCGHFEGKQIIPSEDMVQKLRAACDARVDRDLLIIARTDSLAVAGPEEAIRRSREYVQAGAEMIFVEAPHSREELAHIGRELQGLGIPLMINLVEGGKTPMVPVAELGEMGFSFISFSGSMQKTAIAAMQPMVEALLRTGEVKDFYPEHMVSLEFRSELLGLPAFFELERRYSSS
jgi:2-methylisocitrate lyase-like PEP mutase family enzyme